MAKKPGKGQAADHRVGKSAPSHRIEEQHAQLRDLIATILGTLEISTKNDEQIRRQLATLQSVMTEHFLAEWFRTPHTLSSIGKIRHRCKR